MRPRVGRSYLATRPDEEDYVWTFHIIAELDEAGEARFVAVKIGAPIGSIYTHVFDAAGMEVETMLLEGEEFRLERPSAKKPRFSVRAKP